MRKLFLSVGCALILLATATVSDASIFVKITDGTVAGTVDGLLTASKGGLRFAKASVAPTGSTDATDTLNLLSCATRPCKVFFPSGAATVQPGDYLRLEDDTSTSLARLEKFDSGASSDRVSIRGLKVFSLVAGKVVTMTYGNQPGDLRTLTSAQAASYLATAAMTGNFRAGLNSLTKASACKVGTISTDLDEVADSCLRLSLTVNGAPVDGTGSPVIATVSLPCNNTFPTLSPCGTNGSWTASLGGKFTGVNDSKSINCPSTCSPSHLSTVVAKFNAANEVLELRASTHGALANVTDEAGGGEEVALGLADELGLDRWVTHSAAIERCRAEPKSPAIQDTRNINDNSTLPISFEYWCSFFTPAGDGGIPMVSLADTLLLPGAAGTRYQASREAFLPAPGLLFKDITTLSVSFDVFVGTEASPVDRRLDPVTYADCGGGSIHLAIQLLDNKGVSLGFLKVYPGSTDFGRSGCDGFEANFLNIVGNQDPRVDPSGLAGNLAAPCCVTYADAVKTYGKFQVRKIAFIVGRASPDVPEDSYKATFFDGNVNGFTAQSSLQVVTGETRVFELSKAGVSIVITKLFSPTGAPLGVVKVIRSADITINGNKFTASSNINDIQPESGAEYGISLCPNGAETGFSLDPPALESTTPLGICIADQARMTLL